MRPALERSDESVQAGAHVFTTDGTEMGIVIRVEPTMFILKKSGLLGGEVGCPVPSSLWVEGHHMELTVTKDGLPG